MEWPFLAILNLYQSFWESFWKNLEWPFLPILNFFDNFSVHITLIECNGLESNEICTFLDFYSCEGWQLDAPTYHLLFRMYSGFCSTSLLLFGLCRQTGSLSGGAFNQLKLVTRRIVLTILYLLKPVLQRSLLQCPNSLYKSDEVF